MYVCDNTVFMNSYCVLDLALLRPSLTQFSSTRDSQNN